MDNRGGDFKHESGEVVSLMEGADLLVEPGLEFAEGGVEGAVTELMEFGDVGGVAGAVVVAEGEFEAVGVDEESVAGFEVKLEEVEWFVFEDAEEGAFRFEQSHLAAGLEEDGGRVAGPCEGEFSAIAVERAVARGHELGADSLAGEEVAVEAVEDFVGRGDAVVVAANLAGLEGLLDEHGEEGGGHTVADGVGDVETEMVFIEPLDIVDVAADVAGGPEENVAVHAGQLGETLGEELPLGTSGEAEFFVELADLAHEAALVAAEDGELLLDGADKPALAEGRFEEQAELLGFGGGGGNHHAFTEGRAGGIRFIDAGEEGGDA